MERQESMQTTKLLVDIVKAVAAAARDIYTRTPPSVFLSLQDMIPHSEELHCDECGDGTWWDVSARTKTEATTA